jgi:hypothetical protein
MDSIHTNDAYTIPLFSLLEGVEWISFDLASDKIPIDAMKRWRAHLYTSQQLPPAVLEATGNRHEPEWYVHEKHYRGWSPVSALRDEVDPIGFLFDENPVPLEEETAVISYDRDGGEISVFAGYHISDEWKQKVSHTSEQLSSICMVAAGNSPFYGPLRGGGSLGHMPSPVDYASLDNIRASTRRNLMGILFSISEAILRTFCETKSDIQSSFRYNF